MTLSIKSDKRDFLWLLKSQQLSLRKAGEGDTNWSNVSETTWSQQNLYSDIFLMFLQIMIEISTAMEKRGHKQTVFNIKY